MRKKKKAEETEAGEAWLLPYSDMLTLLLALFIVMFAIAKVDEGKFEEVKSEFGVIFSNNSAGDSIVGDVVDLGHKKNKAATKEESEKTVTTEAAKEAVVAQKMEDEQMAQTRQTIKGELEQANLDNEVSVSLRSDGIHISLENAILFAPGSTELTDTVKQHLDIVCTHVKELDKQVVIAGHSDNVVDPKRSNWELSASRAIAVMDYLISQKAVSQTNISIQAFADTVPLQSNKTAEGREKNRRVEIIIYKDYE